VWDAIHDSLQPYSYITVRRAALRAAKERLGDANYYNGRYPPPVPVWRFRPVTDRP
jgi:hypothetical protein